MELKFNPN